MSLLPKTHQEFGRKEYWDKFFKARGNKSFEWYGEYAELSGLLHKYVKSKDDILIMGCGNSTLGCDLYDVGYRKITNIDISPVVIRQMMSKNEKDRPNLKYEQMDALSTTFENETFSVILDKGTLDALMPDDKLETLANGNKYFKEISRVLRFNGRFVCVSLLQEHILKALLDYFPRNNWMVRIIRCFEVQKKASENRESSMPVFVVVCTKFKSLPNVFLEVNLTPAEKLQRIDSVDDLISVVGEVQKAAFVCSGLKNNSITDGGEISLDLFNSGEKTPRFTVYVVDIDKEHKNADYAAFVVPHGREPEWLFSTSKGRKQLVKMCEYNRLAIISMHEGQQYESFESIQKELSETVVTLAPRGFSNKKILFLSLGSDIGKRTVRFEGNSKLSGSYIIEDIENDRAEKYRRLYFRSTQSVIQSEAKLKMGKLKSGKSKEFVDSDVLICSHHIYMSIAVRVVCPDPVILVIGLGGGSLCSFLRSFLPSSHIVAVDIDKEMLRVAKDWFGLKLDEKLQVVIQDGLEIIQEAAQKSIRYDAVLFDVDSKDTTVGMSCPPKQFLEKAVLRNVSKILKKSSLFILNIVLRDETLRPQILADLKKIFHMTISYKLDDDLNEVIICSSEKIAEDKIKIKFGQALDEINKFFFRNQQEEVKDYFEKLIING